tara:strand:+ start:240 stop:506 length:267 start_codon:yes stop_codon:yes gene_type:complete
MYKNLVILPVFALIIALTGCETPKNNAAIDSAISEAKAAMAKANEAAGTADSANKTAQRAEAMTEQNRSALRALNDKIDRMFRTISRK